MKIKVLDKKKNQIIENISIIYFDGQIQEVSEVTEYNKQEGCWESREIEDYEILNDSGTLEKIAEALGIREAIRELEYFEAPYSKFVDDVDKEIEICEKQLIEGPEYSRRSYLIKFALNMALVYAMIRGDHESIPEIKRLLERAKKI